MLELNGKYATAKIFTDVVDNESISQVIELLNQPYVSGSKIRMMPDIHAGAGCTIGTTMTIRDKIYPNLVGVDIGCGMETVRIKEYQSDIDMKKLDDVIRSKIPSGFAIHNEQHPLAFYANIKELFCIRHINTERALRSIGTLGGGNHFIEVDKDDDNNIYLVVHSGSRHLGVEIANYYQNEAYKSLTSYPSEEINRMISTLKASGRKNEIETTLKQMKSKVTKIPKQLAYVEGSLFDDYLHDMKIAQRYADINRRAMIDVIVETMGFHVCDEFTTVHNYIDVEHKILRKGSVSAQDGERLLIPINMRDGSLLCTGKGNEDWNYSAPHGAGRLMSRAKAKETFSVSEFQSQMEGVYSTSVNESTIDECPMAYKTMEDIVNNIEPTVRIDAVIKPIYNFKAGEES